jgi:hypothetical protein
VTCKCKFDPISQDINEVLMWLTCKNRMSFEILKLAFPIYDGRGSKYFANYLCLDESEPRVTRSNTYIRPSIAAKTWCGERSFKYEASQLWLELPDVIKNCSSYPSFKYLLFKHLLYQQSSEYDSRICDNTCIDRVVNGYHD